MGIKFLKHIERCKSILHLIDINNNDLLNCYKEVRQELKKYSNKLTNKKEIIVLNKIDLLNNEETKDKIEKFQKKNKKENYCNINFK